MASGKTALLACDMLPQLVAALRRQGYRVIASALREGDLALAEIADAAELPRGFIDRQAPGSFRLEANGQVWFGAGAGQYAWKRFLLPPEEVLWQARRQGRGFSITPAVPDIPRYAFLGVRPCDLNALAVLDKVLLGGLHHDPAYRARREQVFIVAVQCVGRECGTGFCESVGGGPRATSGFDLALTEVEDYASPYLAVEVGSSRGAEIMSAIPHKLAGPPELAATARQLTDLSPRLGRTLDTHNLKELLYSSTDHPHWDDVAGRCLNCGNCTAVCPTCFCYTLEDRVDLSGTETTRVRRADACYTVDFSYIHGGAIRPSAKSRYRQWLTHKLAAWQDQFGSLGCVGCGRCITWCPAGIDLTYEVRALREAPAAPQEASHGDH
jgi:ferredoxin